MNLIQLTGAIELGLIYGLVALGVYLTFRVIDFPDLTVDGSFSLGAAVAVSLIANEVNPFLATIAAVFGGALSGCVTAYMNIRWNILGLLAGILTMTALYSINLRIMGVPNISLMEEITLFSDQPVIIIIAIILLNILIGIAFFLKTDLGLAIRAAGINARVSRAYSINVKTMKLIALALSNAIVALSGAIFAQVQSFADISMGTGTIIIGLASVIIGEAIFHAKGLMVALISCVIGSILYRIVIALALNSNIIGLQATDLNLITATLVAVTMVATKIKNGSKS